jgi:predicted thioesterase
VPTLARLAQNASSGTSPETNATKMDRRRIEFRVRASEGAKEIGVGSHSRVVIYLDKFARRLGTS